MNEHTFFEWKRSERLTAALALAFCLLGLGLQRLPGVGFSGKLSWGLAVVCLVLLGLSRLSRRHRGWKILLRIAQIGLAALVLGLSAVEVWVIRAGHRDESAQPADAVIVLGAGVNGTTPSVALQTRIDAAERYLKAHPDIPAVLSGVCSFFGSSGICPVLNIYGSGGKKFSPRCYFLNVPINFFG